MVARYRIKTLPNYHPSARRYHISDDVYLRTYVVHDVTVRMTSPKLKLELGKVSKLIAAIYYRHRTVQTGIELFLLSVTCTSKSLFFSLKLPYCGRFR